MVQNVISYGTFSEWNLKHDVIGQHNNKWACTFQRGIFAPVKTGQIQCRFDRISSKIRNELTILCPKLYRPLYLKYDVIEHFRILTKSAIQTQWHFYTISTWCRDLCFFLHYHKHSIYWKWVDHKFLNLFLEPFFKVAWPGFRRLNCYYYV